MKKADVIKGDGEKDRARGEGEEVMLIKMSLSFCDNVKNTF